jgi:hypothetical protein
MANLHMFGGNPGEVFYVRNRWRRGGCEGGAGKPTAWRNQSTSAPIAGGDACGIVPADLRLGSRGFREDVGGPSPEPQVGQDLLDDRGLVNDCDDPDRSATLWTEQRIDLIDLFDEMSPALLECPGWGERDLNEGRHGWVWAFLLPLP